MSPDVLISTADLQAALPAPDLVLLDVRWSLTGPPGRPDYEAGHVPGARFVELEADLSGPPVGAGGRHPLPDAAVFAAALVRLGVDPDSDVVVYDGGTSLSAARLWWLLTDAGHPRVRVLDGGWAAWTADGGAVETGAGPADGAGTFVPEPGRRERLDGAAIVRTPGLALVDVRAPERFTGETEPMDPVAGHIPGAVNRPSMAHLGPDGRFRPAAEILDAYADLDAPVLYCGSGITAAHTLLALESAGRTDGRIYPGSWSDWVSDPSRPVATGPE